MNTMPEMLLLPAPVAPLMLPAPRMLLLLPAPRIEQPPVQPRVELFWDVPKRTRLPAEVQAALDPNTAQLLKQVAQYLGADRANSELLKAAVADFTAAVQQIGREQCGHKHVERQPFEARQTRSREQKTPTGGTRGKAEMDAEIGDILKKHMDAMHTKFGGANGTNAWH